MEVCPSWFSIVVYQLPCVFCEVRNPFHIIGLEKLMVSFIIGFEDTLMTSAKLVKLLSRYSLNIFNGTCNSHQVRLKLGNINQECVW